MKVNNNGSYNSINVSEVSPPVFNGVFEVSIQGERNEIEFSKGVTGGRLIVDIRGDNNRIIIGENCRLSGVLSIRGDSNTINISKSTTIGSARIECEHGTKIFLGNDCMLSKDIVIRSGDGHSIMDLTTGKRLNNPESVYIGEHVWIGYGVNIGKGVEIQKNSVVGMGSFVNKKFSIGNVILAGVPAKIVTRNIVWDRKNSLNDIDSSYFNNLVDKYAFKENDFP